MSQSDTVSNILERITQETAQVTTKKKIFGMKSKRTAKTPQKKVVLDSSNSVPSSSNSMSPSSSPFRSQQNQIPTRSQSMPAENYINQSSINSPSSSINLSESSLSTSNSIVISNDPFFNEQWDIISPCIDNIFEQGTGGKFEPAFQAVERLCQNKKYCESINDQLLIKIDSFSKIICKKLQPPIDFQSIISVLDFIQHSNALLASIFPTFERSYLSPQLTIEQLVFKHITKAIHADQSIVNGICTTILTKITEQRKEATLIINNQLNNNNEQILKSTQSSSYQQTAFTVNQFDLTKDIIKPLETETINFYSKLELKEETPRLLLKHIQLIIENEEQIINSFTPDIQKISISATRETVYVKKFINELPHLIKTIMDSKDAETMILLSSLISSGSSESLTKSFISSWSNDLKQRCEKILSISSESDQNRNQTEENDDEIIPMLIQIHNMMVRCRDVIGKKTSDPIFRVFKSTINETTFKIAFLLARHSHNLIQSDPHVFIDDVGKITGLFRELDLMDAFFSHCKEFLAIRLMDRYSSIEGKNVEEAERAEKVFLDKIEGICGEDDVAPMREMINESESWRDLNSEFRLSLEKNDTKNETTQEKNDNETTQEKNDNETTQEKNDNETTQEKNDNETTQEKNDNEIIQEKNDNETTQEKTENMQEMNSLDKNDLSSLNSCFPIFFQIFNKSHMQQFTDYEVSSSEASPDKKEDENFGLKFIQTPKEVENTRDAFSNFYNKNYPRKSLKWLPLLDHVTCKLNSTTIECSVLYYVVIDAILNGRSLKETKIEEKTIKELVDVLVSNKIVICDKKGDSDNVFECNFLIAPNDEEKIVYLPNPSLIRPKMLKDEKMEDIFAMRHMRIEAALVLTMKKLKTAKKEDLFDNMRNNSTFRVSDNDLEKCLDSLIDKSYVFTDEEGNIVFTTE